MIQIIVLTLLCWLIGLSSSSECVFLENEGPDWKSPALKKSDCPCFHAHTDPEDPLCSSPLSSKNPLSPLVPCSHLPEDFIVCNPPLDLEGNTTAHESLGYGCLSFGGQRYHEVEKTKVCCRTIDCIECRGNRTFLRDGFPCIKYSHYYFLTTLLYSILLGFLGLDRFCLGKTGTAVGKLLTLGGLGVWWVVDIVLLITGELIPEDGSNWVPNV
ncbi:TM2 domain-containing protein 2 [Lepeophtheirus salmonis]|uniref:TM2 domain-containing protein 2 n=1 Tax=Lepeophtheirus salmonis TaxID=72036 RepID=UPI001AE73010|nr:TM2 domain-containing protein 2-like [Lepeophtheirus salmonis]